MKTRSIPAIVIFVVFLIVVFSTVHAGQHNKSTVKALNGLGFSDFKGYEDWQDAAVSQTEGGIKAILGNPAMMKAYREGIPGNRKSFPEGSKIVKIEWSKKKGPASPYFVEVPDALKSVSFIEKDSRRFKDSSGWGYAQFLYDAGSKTFKPYGEDSSFGTKVCYQCHTAVKEKDYIFTDYPPR